MVSSRPKSGPSRGANVPPRRRSALISIRSFLITSLAVILAIGVSGLAVGGTYARWNKTQDVNVKAASVIVSGTAGLAVTTALAMPTTPMYPGLTVYGSAVVQNTSTSTSPLALSLRSTGLTLPVSNPFSQALTIGLATAKSAVDCSAGAVTSSWVTETFASPASATVGSPFPSGASTVLCVSATLSASAAPNAAENQSVSNFTVAIDGIQN